jgi:hypothetical protein
VKNGFPSRVAPPARQPCRRRDPRRSPTSGATPAWSSGARASFGAWQPRQLPIRR